MKPQRKRPETDPNKPRRRTSRANVIRLGRSATIPILYEDREIMAIDKPAGWMVTTPKWSRTKQNLQREIEIAILKREQWVTQKQIRFLRFVHRLDRDTSGVLLLAKNRQAIVKLSHLFSEHLIKKIYACIVLGRPNLDEWRCTAPIGPCNDEDHRMKIDHEQGLDAVTYFKRVHSTGRLSLILAAPQTGRTHQIRVHLASSGHSILGDSLYATGTANDSPSSMAQRPNKKTPKSDLGLRAWGVKFQHPSKPKMITIEAELTRFLSHYFQKQTALELFKTFRDFQVIEQSQSLYSTDTGRLPIGKTP